MICYNALNMYMRTKYCPHCASEKIHKVEESDGSHFHECDDCQEAWEHHETGQKMIGTHDNGPIRSNN
jgi:ssDNA-binding Zn-finger/Zn-ribbon topoisomerase 1